MRLMSRLAPIGSLQLAKQAATNLIAWMCQTDDLLNHPPNSASPFQTFSEGSLPDGCVKQNLKTLGKVPSDLPG